MAAQVPHYIAANDYPIASLRLLEKIAEVSGLSFPLGALEQESERFSHMLADQVSKYSRAKPRARASKLEGVAVGSGVAVGVIVGNVVGGGTTVNEFAIE